MSYLLLLHHPTLAVYTRSLTDAERTYLEAHTSPNAFLLCLFGLAACIVFALVLLITAAITWRKAKPIKRPTYRRVSALAKLQSVLFFSGIITYWLTTKNFYYHDRISTWPFVVSLFILTSFFAVSMAAILTQQSMHDDDALRFIKMWRGRKAISSSIAAFMTSLLMAALMFSLGMN